MKRVLRTLYNRLLRPYLPRKIAVYNGVPVRNIKLLDQSDVYPTYEEALLEGIRQQVQADDEVVIVGGGLGVSTVVAARQCGPGGSVVTFEGSPERASLAGETLALSNLQERASIREAIVGPEIAVHGETGDVSTVSPEDLPDCDVLVLDCEGAELEILEEPPDARAIVVETHRFLDAPEEDVRALLDRHGYEVVDRGVEVEDLGVFVLTAVGRDGDSDTSV